MHKSHSNLVSKKIHVNTDAEIINEIDMTDGFECFAPSNDIKKKQQKTKKKKFKKYFETYLPHWWKIRQRNLFD